MPLTLGSTDVLQSSIVIYRKALSASVTVMLRMSFPGASVSSTARSTSPCCDTFPVDTMDSGSQALNLLLDILVPLITLEGASR